MSVPFAEVIGDPIAQSKSPAIHNFWLGQLDFKAEYRRQHVASGDIERYLIERRENSYWRGCNVTMPHKQAVIPLLDRLDPCAERIGAVNTIVSEGHQLKGYNTDVAGFLEPLKTLLAQPHYFRMARVLGTGGAARAIFAGLVDEAFEIVVAGRNSAKARALIDSLAPDWDHHSVDLVHFAQPTDFAFDDRLGCLDVIVNASPLGMRGQPPLCFHWSHAPPGAIAYDIVTDPVATDFLADARAAGHRTIDGLGMLIGQAALAFRMFFGKPAPRECDDELRALLTP